MLRRENEILAAIAAGLCLALGYLSLPALNPDGVSYLDLAAAMQRGDWPHFVQGYWSPLFPLIVGIVGLVTGRGGSRLVSVTHVLNTVAAVGAVFILWWWARKAARRSAPSTLGRAFIAIFLICSAGLPRIEAVTPDVILLLVMIWLGYELIAHSGHRWLVVGALLGTAFLAKTSCWPWLLSAIPLRLWAADNAVSRRGVLRSTMICGGIMLAWIVPMSLKYGHPTLGSSGALNWSWYITGNSSRLPDTDRGANTSFQTIDVGKGRSLTVAVFDDAAYWTYQPWGDPTAWTQKVLTQTGRDSTPVELLSYWLRMAARVFGLWLGPLIVAAIVPWIVLLRRPGMVRELLTTQREALTVMLLGVVGLLQFVAIHAEPRLIGPFGALLALGAIHWCFAAPPATGPVRPAALRHGLAWVGIAAAIGFAIPRFAEGVRSAERLRGVTAQLDDLRRRIATVDDGRISIAVVGPAAPIMASAFWVNARIALQVTPQYADLIGTLPPDEQKQMLLKLFRGKVPLLWRTFADGGMEMLSIPPN